jgi:hypothetical protein
MSCGGHKSFFASRRAGSAFSSEKEESSFLKERSKELLLLRWGTGRGH